MFRRRNYTKINSNVGKNSIIDGYNNNLKIALEILKAHGLYEEYEAKIHTEDFNEFKIEYCKHAIE